MSSSTVSLRNRAAREKLAEFAKQEREENARGEFEARCFEIFVDGGDVKTAVVKLRRPVDDVDAVYEKYLELEGAWLIPSSVVQRIHDQVDYLTDAGSPENPRQLMRAIQLLAEDKARLLRLTYPCNVCGKPISPGEDAWKVAKEALMKGCWGTRPAIRGTVDEALRR